LDSKKNVHVAVDLLISPACTIRKRVQHYFTAVAVGRSGDRRYIVSHFGVFLFEFEDFTFKVALRPSATTSRPTGYDHFDESAV